MGNFRTALALTDNPVVTLLVAVVLAWCLLSVAVAFAVGPLSRKVAELAGAREPPRPDPEDRANG